MSTRSELNQMTASIHIFKPRKPKLVTPSDKLSKREWSAKLTRIEWYQRARKVRKSAITYPPELLPVPSLGDDVSIIVRCNRPDCIGDGCRYCGVITP